MSIRGDYVPLSSVLLGLPHDVESVYACVRGAYMRSISAYTSRTLHFATSTRGVYVLRIRVVQNVCVACCRLANVSSDVGGEFGVLSCGWRLLWIDVV